MNIDLLMTKKGEIGLLCDGALPSNVAGIIYDRQTQQLTFEFMDVDPLDLNIAIDHVYGERLYYMADIPVGTVSRGQINETTRVPLVLSHDPFGGGNSGHFVSRPRQSLKAFEDFLKACVEGQPVHRENLGNEDEAGPVIGQMSPATLQFAPQLARQRNLEATPHHAPHHGPGLGHGSGGSSAVRRIQQTRPPSGEDSEKK